MPRITAPRLLPRQLIPRVFIVLAGVLPLGFLAGAVSLVLERDAESGVEVALLGMALGAPLVLLFLREQTFRVWVGAEAIEVHALGFRGWTDTVMRFDEIEEIRLQAGRSRAPARASGPPTRTSSTGPRLVCWPPQGRR